MKRLLFIFVILVPVLGYLAINYKFAAPQSILIAPKQEDLMSVSAKVPPLLGRINQRNTLVKNFVCDEIKVRVWQNGMRFRVTASIYYEKDRHFRMLTKSILGQEVDMGSNDKLFWFWSRRMEPPGLYWAKHEDFGKTRLKSPFNPIFMMNSLGLATIAITNNTKFVDLKNDKLLLIDPHKNSIGQPITVLTYINKQTEKIDGFLVLDEQGAKVASAEILAWRGSLPQQMLYTWFEEDTSMLMEMSNQSSNVVIARTWFELPNLQPLIDMGR